MTKALGEDAPSAFAFMEVFSAAPFSLRPGTNEKSRHYASVIETTSERRNHAAARGSGDAKRRGGARAEGARLTAEAQRRDSAWGGRD